MCVRDSRTEHERVVQYVVDRKRVSSEYESALTVTEERFLGDHRARISPRAKTKPNRAASRPVLGCVLDAHEVQEANDDNG